MLQHLTLMNFKGLKEATLEFGRITVLIGPNGTGKSSVLQSINVLKQSKGMPTLTPSGPLAQLGEYSDIVSHHDRKQLIQIVVSGTVTPLTSFVPGVEYSPFDSVTAATFDGLFSETTIIRQGMAFLRDTEAVHELFWGQAGRENRAVLVLGGERAAQLRRQDEVGRPVSFRSWQNVPDADVPKFQEFFSTDPILADFFVVPPLRGFESMSFPLEERPQENLFAAGTAEQQASRILSTLAYRRELEDELSRFSRRVLNLDFRIQLIAGRRVAAQASSPSTESDAVLNNLVNEGFGANQLLVLLAQLVIAPEGSVIGLEEPEIHLHPLAQSQLADILVEIATQQNKQLILTTHSEHMLLGLLSRLARGQLTVPDLRVFYFSRTDGSTQIELLEADERGRLSGGLKGFFEASLQETDEFLRSASFKRRSGSKFST